MHAGSFRSEDIKPRVPRIAWGKVYKVTENPKSNVVVLHSGLGSMRLFCNEDNYEGVILYVNTRVNIERYVS